VDVRHVYQHARQEPHALEGLAVRAQGELVLGAGVEELEHRARQPRARRAAQLLNRYRV
jgi:hypothetical protein